MLNTMLKILAGDSMPYLLQLLARVRSIIEDSSPSGRDKAISPPDAYGTCTFKCPILACPRFLQGFTTKKLRDEHRQTHRSRFRCTHEGCDYSVFGFLNTKQLAEHLVEHDSQRLEITFPKAQRSSLQNALEYAIDKDDFLSARKLSTEIAANPDRSIGFLLRAVKKRNLEAFKALIPALATKKDIEFRDKLGWAALHFSAQNGSEEMAHLVLEMGADVNAKLRHMNGSDGWDRETPLMIAASRGHSQIVRLLLSQPNRVLDFHPTSCKTPLQLAAEGGHTEALQMILNADGESYAQNKAYMKSIRAAASREHQSAVRLLLERGHELGAEKTYGKALQRLLPNGIESMNGGNSLQLAAQNGKSSEVKQLLQSGADINRFSSTHGTALAAAAKNGHLALVQQLLDNGANAKARNGNFGTALHLAVAGGHEAVVSLLLKNGSYVDDRSGGKASALHQAVQNGHEAIVNLLLQYKANVNTFGTAFGNMRGVTPCQIAAEMDHEAIMRLLLHHGADINAGKAPSALERATSFGIINMLCEKEASVDDKHVPNDNSFMLVSFRPMLQIRFLELASLIQRKGYASLNEDNVLEHFDFDTFLQSTDDGFDFDPSTLHFENDSLFAAEEEDVQPQISPGNT